MARPLPATASAFAERFKKLSWPLAVDTSPDASTGGTRHFPAGTSREIRKVQDGDRGVARGL